MSVIGGYSKPSHPSVCRKYYPKKHWHRRFHVATVCEDVGWVWFTYVWQREVPDLEEYYGQRCVGWHWQRRLARPSSRNSD
jgi:hypothetical protein